MAKRDQRVAGRHDLIVRDLRDDIQHRAAFAAAIDDLVDTAEQRTDAWTGVIETNRTFHERTCSSSSPARPVSKWPILAMTSMP